MRWLVVLLAVAATDAHARPGRVVRVERDAPASRRAPQIYSMQSATHLTTFGRRPATGAELTLINADGVLGVARVVEVEPRLGACQAEVWDVEFEARWLAPEPGIALTTFAIQGIDLDRGAHTVDVRHLDPPSGDPRETVWTGIDRGIDDVADVIVTAYPCGDTEPPHPTRPQADGPMCIDVFEREQHAPFETAWQRTAHDVFYLCR